MAAGAPRFSLSSVAGARTGTARIRGNRGPTSPSGLPACAPGGSRRRRLQESRDRSGGPVTNCEKPTAEMAPTDAFALHRDAAEMDRSTTSAPGAASMWLSAAAKEIRVAAFGKTVAARRAVSWTGPIRPVAAGWAARGTRLQSDGWPAVRRPGGNLPEASLVNGMTCGCSAPLGQLQSWLCGFAVRPLWKTSGSHRRDHGRRGAEQRDLADWSGAQSQARVRGRSSRRARGATTLNV